MFQIHNKYKISCENFGVFIAFGYIKCSTYPRMFQYNSKLFNYKVLKELYFEMLNADFVSMELYFNYLYANFLVDCRKF